MRMIQKHTNKKGFTLAEVLITLTIIGVIAALTIPSLLQNINDAQYHTAWKSAFSDLSQATSRLKQDNGGTLVGVFQDTIDMANKFAPYFSYTKICTNYSSNCWHQANNWYFLNGAPKTFGDSPGFILNNGDLIFLQYSAQNCADTTYTLPICGFIYTDINGFKGPNTVGRDIYLTWITQNGLSPAGYNDTAVGSCYTGGGSGAGCAAKYLMQ